MANETFWTGFDGQKIYADRAHYDRKKRDIADSIDALSNKLDKVKVDGVALPVTTEDGKKVVDVPLASIDTSVTPNVDHSGVVTGSERNLIGTAIQGVSLNGSELTPDANRKVDLGNLKTAQNPVSDPVSSGNTTDFEFISSISQNENGVVSPTKKTIPVAVAKDSTGETDGLISKEDQKKLNGIESGAQVNVIETVKVAGTALTITDKAVDIPDAATNVKGVVKLTDDVSSNDPNSAITPAGIRTALSSRAVFWSAASWETDKPIPGDASKVNYVLTGTGDDKYDVYVWNVTESEYKKVDEISLDLTGYWHDGPTAAGVSGGNVVTDLTLGSDGVPVLTKGTMGDGTLSVTVGSANAQTFTANQTTNEAIVIPLAQSATGQDPATEGLISSTDKAKLDDIESGAEVNAIEIVKKNGTALSIDSADRSVNVVVNDGKLKKKIGSDATATEIFSADTASDYTLEIPLASADTSGASPVYTEGLMSAADKQKLDETVSAEDATITIDMEGWAQGATPSDVGSFTTNQSTDDTITIPVAVSAVDAVPAEIDETTGDVITPAVEAVPAKPGLMSSADKDKLDSLVSANDATITVALDGWAASDTPVPAGDFTTNQSANETIYIPTAASAYETIDPDTQDPVYHPAKPGLMSYADKNKLDSISGIFNVVQVTDSSGQTSTIQASNTHEVIRLVAGQNVELISDPTQGNDITIESTGGSGAGATVSAGRGIAVNPTVDQQTGVTDYEVSLDNATGYLGSTCTIASVSTSPVDILDPSATPSIDSQNDRFVVQLNQTDNHVYLYALKTVKDALNPSNDVAGVDVFTLSYNVQVSRTQTNGFYGMAGVQIQRDSSSTIVLHSSTESYPSQVGECSVNGCATIWNNSGNETTIGGKVYYGYRLIYTGDASTGVSDILGVVARFTAIENMSGTAEYTGSMTTYNAGAAIDISQSNDISVVTGQGLTVDPNTNSLQINLATDSGLTFASEGGLLALKLNNVTEAVVQEVQKMSSDMDSKLTTTFDMAQITNVYDFADSGVSSIGNGAGMIFQAFTVPINNSIRLSTASQDGTLFGIYAKQSYATKIMLALYMYNFDDDSTEYIADTGAVSVAAGRNEFPIQHINSAVSELESKNVYYAALYLPSTRNNGLILAGCESYSSAGNINVIPRFTVRSENLTVNGSEIDLDVAADARLNYLDPNDPTRYLIGPWSNGYNEQPGVPRFFMQIRNGHVGGGNNNA